MAKFLVKVECTAKFTYEFEAESYSIAKQYAKSEALSNDFIKSVDYIQALKHIPQKD